MQLSVVKAQLVSDPFGGNEAVPGATITYTVTVEVTSAGTATNATVSDPIPQYTTYSTESIALMRFMRMSGLVIVTQSPTFQGLERN